MWKKLKPAAAGTNQNMISVLIAVVIGILIDSAMLIATPLADGMNDVLDVTNTDRGIHARGMP